MVSRVCGDSFHSLPVNVFYDFFPVPAAVGRPLEGELPYRPGLAELGSHLESGPQDVALQVRLIGLSRGAARGKIEKGGAGRLEGAAHIPETAHSQRGQAPGFQSSCDQSHGPMASRSEREEKDEVHSLRVKLCLDG